ncbi:short-chain dehydrogenase [Siphonobacter sp. BAB-5405]|uniref:SDR family NAD(P)-dependent oxidoreductase n=1 Tax=Siphonobacter sp. BAB-5405 TaxID=1864825 RepID=UPI000C808298|nr:SDR family oxidoreductase [Siphonobacter sp. BAB-5405]PMD92323.1 short-chain dehydrogenase [Siphonobacter sp. BAB-5405]
MTRKIALVTGGSRGLGRDMALRMAQKGIDVILTYHTQPEKAVSVAAEIETLGQKAAVLPFNVGAISELGTFVSALQTTLQETFAKDKFDFLVNNAGMNLVIPSFAETTEDQFDTLLNIHFKGVFFLTQKLLPFLNDNGGIVNISTGLTRLTFPGSATYASMKAGIEVLTRYLAKELGPRGINVNVVAPGAIATDFSGGRLKNTPQLQEHLKSVTAIPRIGQPEDIGGVVAFLCTPEAKWVNAQRIEVSGGLQL